ncbi:FAD-dependent oxidoreductase [Bosea sp. PAMC 26642]|uniref:FAD-dependent oxidoreductase n=1 Tax=Bosea sp. (strain PAMC 26642) TaxID=1792307 RepID=UPI00077067DF|nr:FAD-dependent oxidoreductase [Bosea sp. PAMC 26642]AMJ59816.1 hypothetical protein AXW83_05420 [Bosea sp. PAMC 26642]
MRAATGNVVLVGGGHTHVQVIAAFGSRPEPGLTLTLVTDQLQSPYSGMLPGHVAGLYRHDEMHIDLVALAAATGTRLVHARATGVDSARKLILCEDRQPIAYDITSLNVGITPDLASIAGADVHGIAVKPIGSFLSRFEGLSGRGGPRRIAIVGNGAAGVELAFALKARLQDGQQAGTPCEIVLIGSGPVVEKLNPGIRRRVERALDRHGIERRDGLRVIGVEPNAVATACGQRFAADATLISTRAKVPPWLAATGLPLGPNGFIATRTTLQVSGETHLFAVGDCAEIIGHPREKAGVYAVRQGPVLARNIRRLWQGTTLEPHHPQADYLVLLGTGDGSAIGGRGRWLAFEGRWAWRLKDWIDRRFMARFTGR